MLRIGMPRVRLRAGRRHGRSEARELPERTSVMAQYALASHVFVCLHGEHVVFLDVRKDRYFAIESFRTERLGNVVAGWPVLSPSTAGPDRNCMDPVVSLLLEKEILTSRETGKPAAPVEIPDPVAQITGESLDDPPRRGIGSLARFVMASVRARLLLNHCALESVVARVSHRNRFIPSPPDDGRIEDLISIYAGLRPFFFTAKDACLVDALSLHEFLSAYGVHARWVFGVQARPFAAHCWLQIGSVVLNDTAEHVRRYTPIMIV
jgi:hypothetical protein